MKKSLRFASAALALTLAAGCAMPAFAAGKSSFSKSETVYAVMNGDGSIKNTTVSEQPPQPGYAGQSFSVLSGDGSVIFMHLPTA